MVAETTRASAAPPMPAIKRPKATIQPQRGLRLSITLRKFSGGSGNGPVLTEYAIDLILALSFNQPGVSLSPPAPFFPRTSSPFLARCPLMQASLFLIVIRCLAEKHGLAKPCGELLIN